MRKEYYLSRLKNLNALVKEIMLEASVVLNKTSKTVTRKPSYYTPAKNIKKFKPSKNKPITTRKRIEKSYDEEEKDSVNQLNITNEKYEPEYTLNQKVVLEQSHEEDDYGSEFDKLEASISMKKETENVKAAGSMLNATNTQETSNLSSKPCC